jgi:hypothetical protein
MKPILTYKAGEYCEATLLHPAAARVPQTYHQRMLELRHTLWIKLMGNEWLHVTPTPEVFTFFCENESPKSITLEGRGQLKLKPGCKGYSAHTTIYAYATFESNITFPDIIPIPPIDFDCCLTSEQQKYLDKIQLNLPLSNVLSHVDELKITSHKIDEVNDLINNEKWKIEHSTNLHYTSWATIAGLMSLIIILSICCSCCCCNCCRKFGFWLWQKWQPLDCIDAMRKQCSLHQTIHTGNVHYHGSTLSLPTLTAAEQPTDGITSMHDEKLGENTPIASRARMSAKLKMSTWR